MSNRKRILKRQSSGSEAPRVARAVPAATPAPPHFNFFQTAFRSAPSNRLAATHLAAARPNRRSVEDTTTIRTEPDQNHRCSAFGQFRFMIGQPFSVL